MFGFKNKSKSEELLRKECLKYAIDIMNPYLQRGDRMRIDHIELADIILTYIKTGIIDKRLYKEKLGR